MMSRIEQRCKREPPGEGYLATTVRELLRQQKYVCESTYIRYDAIEYRRQSPHVVYIEDWAEHLALFPVLVA